VIRIAVDDKRARALLRQISAKGASLKPELGEIGATIQGMVDLAFRRERAPFGGPWAPLRPVTLERRRKGDPDSKAPQARILRDTGTLAGSFMIQRLTQTQVEVGSELKYSGTHQYGARKGQYGTTRRGSPIPWGDIPARPMLPDATNVEFQSAVRDILVAALLNARDRA